MIDLLGTQFDTPLRAGALGVLGVAATVMVVGLVLRHPRWPGHVLVLVGVALGMIVLSNALR